LDALINSSGHSAFPISLLRGDGAYCILRTLKMDLLVIFDIKFLPERLRLFNTSRAQLTSILVYPWPIHISYNIVQTDERTARCDNVQIGQVVVQTPRHKFKLAW